MLGSKQARDIDQFFCRCRHGNIIYYISQSWYALPKNTIRKNCSVFCIFKQTKIATQSLYNDVAGLDMSRKEWYDFCRMAWDKPHIYIQINRLEDINNRYTIRNVSNKYILPSILQTNRFQSSFLIVNIFI